MKESEILEFKESTSQMKKGVISISSILNKHQKGTLYFGFNDDGTPIGTEIGKNTLRDISKAVSEGIEPRIYPSIKRETIGGKTCIKVEFEGKNTPYLAYGRAYIRTADEDRLLSGRELEEMIIKKNKDNLRWDDDLCQGAKLSDISSKKLKDYALKAGLSYTSKKELLESLGLLHDGKLTNASLVLFGVNPSKFFRLLNLRCATFLGG